jgi:putative sporulation protein YtxC
MSDRDVMAIGVREGAEELERRLYGVREELGKQGILMRFERNERGGYSFLTYQVSAARDEDAALCTARQQVAGAVADFVMQVVERAELERIIADEYYYDAAEEVEYLANKAMQLLADLRLPDGRPLRRTHIAEQVLESLRSSQELVLEGLIRFRLQPMQTDLYRGVEQAIDEYLIDLEVQEFVKLLRYFLTLQEPGMPVLHLMLTGDGQVRMFGAEGESIPLEEAEFEVEASQLHALDRASQGLLSALISLAPEKLYLHLPSMREAGMPLVETVKKVFESRVLVCTICSLCEREGEWRTKEQISTKSY